MPSRADRRNQPAYQSLYRSGELRVRCESALGLLESCRVCPRRCEVSRLEGELGTCQVGRSALVSSCFPHFGEEDCLRGTKGSGTIFFSGCNLRCAFCQNFDISHRRAGEQVTPERLAEMMMGLQSLGCHNINLVTPSHVVPQVIEALAVAIPKGLEIPVVYNTGGYDRVETLQLLDGLIDIYMPDLKFVRSEVSEKFANAPDYFEVAAAAIKEMHRQVGDLVLDEDGIALRGLLVRHLIMPDGLADTRAAMEFLAREVSPDTYVNLMPQYHPAGCLDDHPELMKRIGRADFDRSLGAAREAGIHRFDERKIRILSSG